MKRTAKIIALFLSVCCVISCFSVFAFANGDETSPATVSEDDTTKEYYVPYGFDKFIDVEEYKANAGKEGYNELKIVGVNSPALSYIYYDDLGNLIDMPYYEWGLSFYVYNPRLHPMYCRSYPGEDWLVSVVNGRGVVKDLDDTDYKSYSVRNRFSQDYYTFEDDFVTDAMFFTFTVNGIYKAESVAEGTIAGTYLVDKIFISGYGGVDENGKTLIHDFEFDLDLELNYDNYFENLDITSPDRDISIMTDISLEDIHTIYPKNFHRETACVNNAILQLCFIYEDLDNEELYFYFYNSYGDKFYSSDGLIKEICFELKQGSEEKELYFLLEHISTVGTLSKYKISDNSGYGNGYDCKDNLFEGITSEESREYLILGFEYSGNCSTVTKGYNVQTEEIIYRLNDFSVEDYVYCEAYYYFDTQEIATYSGDASQTSMALNISSNSLYFDENAVGDTYYRLNSSASGKNSYTTLRSVYFSIPNYHFGTEDANILNDKWLEYIKGSYEWANTGIGIVLGDDKISIFDNKSWFNLLSDNKSKEQFNGTILIGQEDVTWGTNFNGYFAIDDGSYEFPFIGAIKVFDNFSFLFNIDSDSYEDFSTAISKEGLENAVANSKNPFSTEFARVDYTLTKDDVFNMLTRDQWSFFESVGQIGLFDTIFKRDYDSSIENISAFITFDEAAMDEALALSDADFAGKYFVSLSDVTDIKEKMSDAKINGETFVLFRFDVYDYYATSDIVIASNDVSYVGEPDGFAFMDKYYKNFEMLEFGFSNSQEATVVQVNMQPIDLGTADITSPYPETSEKIKQEIGEVFDDISIEVQSFWDKLKEVGKIILIIAGVVALIPVVIGIVKLVRWVVGKYKKKK